MTGELSRLRNGEGPSSSGHQISDRNSLDGLDGDEAADLSLENALLAEDPLHEHNNKAP